MLHFVVINKNIWKQLATTFVQKLQDPANVVLLMSSLSLIRFSLK